MKTIQFLSEAISAAKKFGTPANIQVGTFNVHFQAGTRTLGHTITFRLEFLPQHIQFLKSKGVKIEFETVVMAGLSPAAKRFKSAREAIKQGRYAPYFYMGDPANTQTGVTYNWLHATASCTIEVLEAISKFCRYNHLSHVAIDNAYQLSQAGWDLNKKAYTPTKRNTAMERIQKLIRKNANDKRKGQNLLLVEQLAMKKIYY